MITCQRPASLERLLEGIQALEFVGPCPEARVLVVDNDPDGSAREVCERLATSYRWPLQWYLEPNRGIPQARNRALDEAGSDLDYLVFIDDDEVPNPGWLEELLRVSHAYDADIVTGPVLPRFSDSPPEWAVVGRCYERVRHRTGQMLDAANTGNLLMRAAVLRHPAARFDERMSLTGGSDSHFTRKLHRAGFLIVWADDAAVSEWLPASRVTIRWLWKRSFRVGTTMAWVDRDLNPSFVRDGRRVLDGSANIAGGMLALPMTLLGKHLGIRAFSRVCVGAGLLAGTVGGRYEEYRHLHGE